MATYQVTITFTEPLLGTVPLNTELYQDYIASKAPNGKDMGDELNTVDDVVAKGTTGFHRLEDGTPVIYDYVINQKVTCVS